MFYLLCVRHNNGKSWEGGWLASESYRSTFYTWLGRRPSVHVSDFVGVYTPSTCKVSRYRVFNDRPAHHADNYFRVFDNKRRFLTTRNKWSENRSCVVIGTRFGQRLSNGPENRLVRTYYTVPEKNCGSPYPRSRSCTVIVISLFRTLRFVYVYDLRRRRGNRDKRSVTIANKSIPNMI